jgi:hypothetical protein
MNLSFENSIFSETVSLQKKEISSLEIQLLLEWAGEKLLSLPIRNTKPQSYKNNWPEFKQLPNQDFSHKSFRPSPPNGEEIDTLDKIFDLILILSNPTIRRIIQVRSLINPLSHRHLYPWLQIAELLNLDRRTVKRHYDFGLNQIAKNSRQSHILFLLSKIS